jgi:hypothetical protein
MRVHESAHRLKGRRKDRKRKVYEYHRIRTFRGVRIGDELGRVRASRLMDSSASASMAMVWSLKYVHNCYPTSHKVVCLTYFDPSRESLGRMIAPSVLRSYHFLASKACSVQTRR